MGLVDDYFDGEKTTGRLSLNGQVRGRIDHGRDEDWFAVMLQAGVTYYLTSDIPTSTSGFSIGFFDPRAGRIVLSVGGGPELELGLEFTPGATGIYYAVAADLIGNFAGTAYTLGITPRLTPDDLASNPSTAGVLTLDAPARGVFEQRGDVDWFRFRAEQGFHYTFDASGAESANLPAGRPAFLTVFDAHGRQVGTPGAGFNPLVSGDYYISVDGARTGAYAVTASAVPDDFPQHEGSAGRLAAGGQAAGSIDYEHDRDWFRVDLREGEYYHFQLRSEQDYVFGIRLYDQDGTVLEQLSAFQSGGSLGMSYRAQTTGAAYLEVERHLTATIIDHATPYALTLASAVDAIGHDAASAARLAAGASAQGSLQGGADRDAFILNLQAGESYRFDLRSAPGGDHLRLALYASDLPALLAGRGVGTAGSVEFTPSASGDYLVMVESDGFVPPDLAYTLTAVRADDDWAAHGGGAGQLGVGASVRGTLESAADRDWLAFQATAGTTYWIEHRWDASATGSGAAIRILDALGGESMRYTVPFLGHAAVAFEAETAGTYFVEIASAEGAHGAYTVSAAVGTADDIGGSSSSAAVLAIGTAVDGQFEVGSDVDMFRLDAIAGRTYVLTLDGSTMGVSRTTLSDADGKEPSAFVRDNQMIFVATHTGPYYLSLAGGAPGAYRVQAQAYLDDHPDTVTPAVVALAEGAAVKGVLEHGFDVDMFSIQLDADRTYTFKMTGASPDRPAPIVDQVRVGSGYASIEQTVADGERVLTVRTDQAGTYMFGVRSGDLQPASYTFASLPFGGDGAGPFLLAQSRADHATGIALTERTISFTFSEEIVADLSAIVIRDSAGAPVQQAYGVVHSPILQGDTLVLTTMTYLTPGTYTVSLPASAIHDMDGNRYIGPETLSFTTILPTDRADPGNGLYVGNGTGALFDGGAGIDTYLVKWDSTFTSVVPHEGDLLVWSLLDGTYDVIRNIERLFFNSQAYALDVDGVAGQAYRLYQAAFARTPDRGGLGFWIEQMDRGMSLQAAAQAFVTSKEFASLYGAAPSDSSFVQAVYQNVLHRLPDAAGLSYWSDALQAGMGRHELLAHFSESSENREALAEVIGTGFYYLSTSMG